MKRVALEDVLVMARNGLTVKQDKSSGGLPVSRIETIWNATIDKGRLGYAGLTKADADGWLLEPGDILFSHINSLDHLGKVAIYQGDPPELIHGMNLLCLRANPEQINPRFLLYVLRTQDFRGRLLKYVNQSVNQVSVSLTNLRRLEIPLPSLAEQKRIAAVLDKADDLRTKRRQALATLDTLLQSVFLDIFGDPVTNPKGWPVENLGNLAFTTSGGTPDRSDPDGFGGPIPWVKSGELDQLPVVTTEETLTLHGLNNSSAKLQPLGTVLLALYGATVGKTSMLGIEAATNQALCCIQPGKRLTNLYVLHFLRNMTPHLLSQRVGGAQPNISQQIVRAMRTPVPPLSVQERYSDFLARHAVTRERSEMCAIKLDTLFASLQSAAFAGTLFTRDPRQPLANDTGRMNRHGNAADDHAKARTRGLADRHSL